LAVQGVLGDLAAAFGHSFVMKEDKIAEASVQAFGSPMTQETIDACQDVNCVLAVSQSGRGVEALAQGLNACIGSHSFRIPACMSGHSLLKSGALPEGVLVFPLSMAQGLLSQAAKLVYQGAKQAGLGVREIPFTGKLSDAWTQATGAEAVRNPQTIQQVSTLDQTLPEILMRPDKMGIIFAHPAACKAIRGLAATISGLPSFMYDCYISHQPIVYAATISGEVPDGDSPFSLLYAAVDMLRHSFMLAKEADCLYTSITNVLEAGWRTQDIALPGDARISTSAICSLISEQMSLVGHLIKQ
jgi:isocitrate/isopropylmalate dehydrogenase